MKAFLRSVEDRLERIGLKQSASAVARATRTQYWAEAGTERWRSDSHWRGASAFESDDDWLSVGADHVELTRRLAPHVLDRRPNALRILEWGAGGGANAVHFAPLADEFIAVEIVRGEPRRVRPPGGVCVRDPSYQSVLRRARSSGGSRRRGRTAATCSSASTSWSWCPPGSTASVCSGLPIGCSPRVASPSSRSSTPPPTNELDRTSVGIAAT